MTCKICHDHGWYEMGGYDRIFDEEGCSMAKKLRIKELESSIKSREKTLREDRKLLKKLNKEEGVE